MRHLELHVIETEHDIDLALQSGILSLDRLNNTECSECAEPIGYTDTGFGVFAVVIDETDEDWALCEECASPVLEGGLLEASDSVEWLALAESSEEDEDLEQF